MAPMDVELNLGLLLDHAVRHAAEVEIVTRTGDGSTRRYTYEAFGRRVNQLMHALDRIGLPAGTTVGTLAWNHDRHLEAYFAIPCSGRVIHTLNPRLGSDDLAYTVQQADDRVIFVDPDFVPLLDKIPDALVKVDKIVLMGDRPGDLKTVGGVETVVSEDLIADEPESYSLREIPERSPAGICFTSGTTGRPKGVVYSHRGSVLHAMALTSGAGMMIGPGDCVCAQVPMFHVNCFGLPHAAAAVGAKQVLNAGSFDPSALVDLFISEEVTFSAGVTTIWQQVAADLKNRDLRLPHLRRIINGGSRPPASLVRTYYAELDIRFLNAFGMTEGTALLAVAVPKPYMKEWDANTLAERFLPLAGVQMRIAAEDGAELPWDGISAGRLQIRGPWVAASYLGGAGADQFTDDGWFDPGDAAIGHADGYFTFVDRTKDLVKSGGEWISSADMEEAITKMPQVQEAAVIAVPDVKWGERPMACVVPVEGAAVELAQLAALLEGSKFPRWQLPDRMEILDALPRTSVGKVDKKALRARFASRDE